MNCTKCGNKIPDESIYCCFCRKKQSREQKQRAKRVRGNGQGTTFQLQNHKWCAVKTLGYFADDDGKLKRKIVKKSTFTTKRDAVAWLATAAEEKKESLRNITFRGLYDLWLPTHKAGKSTIDCYKAAIKYFEPLWFSKMDDISIDDLQDCMDECPKGKRTRQNMKAVCGLVYKYGIPRDYVPKGRNLAQYLIVTGDESISKSALQESDVEKIRKSVGSVTGADYVYCQIYLGFRPSELLDLRIENYNRKERAFIGGAKTEAGKDRTVTVSPKIQKIINGLLSRRDIGYVFCSEGGERMSIKEYRKLFYDVLDKAGIENPTTDVGGMQIHKYTPHSCRHTFATMLKHVQAADKDKLELIGHTSEEMLRYYQDVNLEDLRRITDVI